MKTKLLLLYLFIFTSLSAQTGWFSIGALSDTHHNDYGDIYAFDANHVCVMADNGHYYETTDGGAHWSHTDLAVTGRIYDLTFNNNLGVAVGDNGILLLTYDAGNNWQAVQAGTNETLYETAILDSSNIWVAGANGVLLHSDDAGATWQINTSLTGQDIYTIQFKDSQTGYFAGAQQTLYKTTDAGAGWQRISVNSNTIGVQNFYKLSIADNKMSMLAGNSNRNKEAFISTDEINWNRLNSYFFYSDIVFIDDNTMFLSGILLTTYNNSTQIRVVKKTTNNIIDSLIFNTDFPEPAGSTFTNSLFFLNPSTGFLLTGDFVFKTIDGGSGLTQVDESTLNGVSKYDKDFISLYPNPGNDFLTIHIKPIK